MVNSTSRFLAALDPSAAIAAPRLRLLQVAVLALVAARPSDAVQRIGRMSPMQRLHSVALVLPLEQARLRLLPARLPVALRDSLRDRLRSCWCSCWMGRLNYRSNPGLT